MNILGGILISLFKDAAGVISTAWGMLNQFFGATWKVTKEYNKDICDSLGITVPDDYEAIAAE